MEREHTSKQETNFPEKQESHQNNFLDIDKPDESFSELKEESLNLPNTFLDINKISNDEPVEAVSIFRLASTKMKKLMKLKPPYYTDKDLVNGILKSDYAMTKYIYQTFQPKILGQILNRGGTVEDAKDIFQETYLDLQENIKNGDYKPKGKLINYFITIALNKLHNQFRKQKKSETFKAQFSYLNANKNVIKNKTQDKEVNFIKMEIMCAEIEKLQDSKKDILNKFYWEGKEIKEIAKDYNTTVGAMKVRLHRCKSKLGKLVTKELIKRGLLN